MRFSEPERARSGFKLMVWGVILYAVDVNITLGPCFVPVLKIFGAFLLLISVGRIHQAIEAPQRDRFGGVVFGYGAGFVAIVLNAIVLTYLLSQFEPPSPEPVFEPGTLRLNTTQTSQEDTQAAFEAYAEQSMLMRFVVNPVWIIAAWGGFRMGLLTSRWLRRVGRSGLANAWSLFGLLNLLTIPIIALYSAGIFPFINYRFDNAGLEVVALFLFFVILLVLFAALVVNETGNEALNNATHPPSESVDHPVSDESA